MRWTGKTVVALAFFGCADAILADETGPVGPDEAVAHASCVKAVISLARWDGMLMHLDEASSRNFVAVFYTDNITIIGNDVTQKNAYGGGTHIVYTCDYYWRTKIVNVTYVMD